jgi:hypothetical protein
MKAYYDISFRSRGIERVIHALDKYTPDTIEKESFPNEAELIVLHVVGRHDHIGMDIKRILGQGKKFAIIQYALQSTRNPKPADWIEYWNKAELVWSYYDLGKYCKNFYHAPLAAEPEVFYPENKEKKYLVSTTGDTYKIECIGDVRLAAWTVNGRTAHLGHKLDTDPNTDYFEDITDDELRGFYNSSQWCSSLRRKDGFELGAVEALMCGTRPIMFDTPNYRQWFDGLATFVPECKPGELSGRLKRIFLNGVDTVSNEEIQETKNRFNWKEIINGFWNSILHQQ